MKTLNSTEFWPRLFKTRAIECSCYPVSDSPSMVLMHLRTGLGVDLGVGLVLRFRCVSAGVRVKIKD